MLNNIKWMVNGKIYNVTNESEKAAFDAAMSKVKDDAKKFSKSTSDNCFCLHKFDYSNILESCLAEEKNNIR